MYIYYLKIRHQLDASNTKHIVLTKYKQITLNYITKFNKLILCVHK